MNLEVLLTAAILGVIFFHALWRGGWRTQARPTIPRAPRYSALLRVDFEWAAISPGVPARSERRMRTAARAATFITSSLVMLSSVALAAPPELGEPVLTVDSSGAGPGSSVAVRGAGFERQVEGMLALDGDVAGMPAFRVRDNGTFEEQLDLPASLTPGRHVISADAHGEVATAQFIAAVAPSQPSGPVVSPAATPWETVAQNPLVSPFADATSGATAAPISTSTSAPTPNPTTGSTPNPTTGSTPRPSPSLSPIFAPASTSITHVVVVWMENEEAKSITSSSMPYLYGLSQQYGRADQYFAVRHPSEPNYLAFWSGSTQGVTDDGVYNLAGPSLSSQMTAAGQSWRTYAQNYPSTSGCHTGSGYSGGVDGWGVAGTYARKHNPAMSFTDVSGSAACANIQPLARFDPSVNLAFVVPNLCNDMHDCSLASGDRFLQAFLPNVFTAPDWAHTLLIVTFDEGSTSTNGGGQVFTMVARPGVAGLTSSTTHNHYGLLRTIEDIFGLPCLNSACSAKSLSEFLP
jgi:hypothetical protein